MAFQGFEQGGEKLHWGTQIYLDAQQIESNPGFWIFLLPLCSKSYVFHSIDIVLP